MTGLGSSLGRLALLSWTLVFSACLSPVQDAGRSPATGPVASVTAPATSSSRFTVTSQPSPQASPTNVPLATEPLTIQPSPTSTNAACTGKARVVKSNLNSAIAGGPVAFRVYLPPCYGELGRTYPALYMFHGSAHTDSHWDDLGLDETATQLIEADAIPPLLIIMPSGNPLAQNSSGGPWSFEGLVMQELIPAVEAAFCVWPEPGGRAIGGLSRGGYWALEIAFRHPGQFASVGGHSAALLDTYAGADLNPRYTGVNRDLGDLRIYLDIGRDDWVLPQLLDLHDALVDKGVTHTWQLNEGEHTDEYWAANSAAYLRWYTSPWTRNPLIPPPCQHPPPTDQPLRPEN